jgi:hypothetical protein
MLATVLGFALGFGRPGLCKTKLLGLTSQVVAPN